MKNYLPVILYVSGLFHTNVLQSLFDVATTATEQINELAPVFRTCSFPCHL